MVNITDFEAPEAREDVCKLTLIFDRQIELMEKYHPIEESNGLLITHDVPVGLDDRKGQQRLKDFAWRFTEEMIEAKSAIEDHPGMDEHFYEEMIDALHFLVELNVLAGITPDAIQNTCLERIRSSFKVLEDSNGYPDNKKLELTYLFAAVSIPHWPVLTEGKPLREYQQLVHLGMMDCFGFLGRAMNSLKNKPWKQTHMITDREVFFDNMFMTFIAYVGLMDRVGVTPDEMYNLYFRKSEVNKFRQRSQY